MAHCEHCIVKEINSFKILNKEELKHLSHSKNSIFIKKGDFIFKERDAMNGVYCIREGMCKLVKMNSKGKDTILKLIKKGEVIGQRSVLSEEVSNLSAIAMEDMHVCFIPKSEILHLFQSNHKFSLEVTKDICHQLKEANDLATFHTHHTVKERLAHTLIYLLEQGGKDKEDFLNLHLSREEIAGMVGTATESCIRLLSELKKEGYIELSGKKIKIIKVDQLKKLIE